MKPDAYLIEHSCCGSPGMDSEHFVPRIRAGREDRRKDLPLQGTERRIARHEIEAHLADKASKGELLKKKLQLDVMCRNKFRVKPKGGPKVTKSPTEIVGVREHRGSICYANSDNPFPVRGFGDVRWVRHQIQVTMSV